MCGIAGCIIENSPSIVKELLIQLQHRGQESSGIAFIENNSIKLIKGFGFVNQVIPDELPNSNMCIGHVRYSTTGTYTKNINEIQPFHIKDSEIEFSFAFNGTILNYKKLRKELQTKYYFITDTDTEVFTKLIFDEFRKTKNIVDALYKALRKIVGSYSLTILSKDFIVIARDVYGFKPLTYVIKDNLFVFASESCALSTIFEFSINDIKEVKPGEIILINKDLEIEYSKLDINVKPTFCAFEYIYFSRSDSIFNNVLIYTARERMGELLAEDENYEIDFVIPIPDTGRIAAFGYSRRLNKPIIEALIKCRYFGRSFIMPPDVRSKIAKFNIIEQLVFEKNIALVDDSLVRGTTLRNIIRRLRKFKCKSIHVRIASPPIRYPCFMGIDFPTRSELIAHNRSIEEICKLIEANSLRYLSIEKLKKAIGIESLCLACFTGIYPFEVNLDLIETELRRS